MLLLRGSVADLTDVFILENVCFELDDFIEKMRNTEKISKHRKEMYLDKIFMIVILQWGWYMLCRMKYLCVELIYVLGGSKQE